MLLGEYISNYRKENNLSMKELSEKCNLSKGYISMLENNFKPSNTGKNITPSITVIKKLADGMNTDFDYLLSMINGDVSLVDEDEMATNDYYDNIFKIETKKLPFLGSIACGEPIFASEDRESYVMVGMDVNADFCLKCKGDSMINARIHDGDIVFIRKQDIVANGEIAAIIIEDEATLKRFYYYKDQNMVILKPENSKYEDIVLMGEQLEKVKVLGKAVAFQSDVI